MKHVMAVGAIALMATGLSWADGTGVAEKARMPGLPAGWTAQGMTGQDAIAVERTQDDSDRADLVVVRRSAAAPGRPLAVYQVIDAAPWRGRTIVFGAYLRGAMERDAMRAAGHGAVAEMRIECDGRQPGVNTSAIHAGLTRRWLENNLAVDVADDATRCSIGVMVLASAEVRLSRVRLRDRTERESLLARRWPEWSSQPAQPGDLRFAAGAAPVAAPNLAFLQ